MPSAQAAEVSCMYALMPRLMPSTFNSCTCARPANASIAAQAHANNLQTKLEMGCPPCFVWTIYHAEGEAHTMRKGRWTPRAQQGAYHAHGARDTMRVLFFPLHNGLWGMF